MKQPPAVKRTLTINNLLTFADLGYFEPYNKNIKEALLYTKRLEEENYYLRNRIAELENTVDVEEIYPQGE